MHPCADPYTALIILNYNNVDDTLRCIESVLEHNSAPVRFVVVDNGSMRPGAVPTLSDFLSSRFPGDFLLMHDADTPPPSLPMATLIASESNDGYARGNNKALRAISADTAAQSVLILNNDILFTSDIIPTLLDTLASTPDAAVVCPVLLTADGASIDYNCARAASRVGDMIKNNFFHYFYRLIGLNDDDFIKRRHLLRHYDFSKTGILPIDLPSGSCMMVRKALLLDIGGFDPNTFLYYEEDILHKKFLAKGLRSYIVTGLRCIHIGACSTSGARSEFVLKASRQSQKYYVETYSGASSPVKLLYRASLSFHSVATTMQKFLKRLFQNHKVD